MNKCGKYSTKFNSLQRFNTFKFYLLVKKLFCKVQDWFPLIFAHLIFKESTEQLRYFNYFYNLLLKFMLI